MSLYAGEDEMHPALQHESSISISSIFELCVCDFRTLVSTLLSQDRPTDVISCFQEEFGRLRIWAGNFGAQREETDNKSLDYALKDAPELYCEVIDHFSDLDEVVKEATVISLGEKISFKVETSESETEISDPDRIGQDPDGEDFESFELEEYLIDIRHTITSLNRFATTLENPAGHQQLIGKSQAQKSAMTYVQCDNRHSATKHHFQPSVQVQPPIKAQHVELLTHRPMQDHQISQSKVPNREGEDAPAGAFADEAFRESPGEAFQGRITPGLIQDEYHESGASSFVRQYVMEDMILYHKALSAVKELCDQVLSDHGIGHATELRLKEPASLEKKLADRERKRGFPYQTIEDIDKDIVDLAGVCILVHVPSNRARASELLRDAFMVKKIVNHPKQDEVHGDQQVNRGYVATHLHVLLKSEDHDRGLQLSETKPVEIQVTSTGLRAWASLEHDIIYKPKGKPRLPLPHQQETMRMLVSVSDNIHEHMEKAQNNRAAKRKRSLRFIDDVDWVFQKWLEEQQEAWFHDREAGSCTSLFNFLQSRNMDTHGGLRQVLEASFGSDSEAVYSRLASEYPTGSLTLVIFIMDRLLLTGGSGNGSGGVDCIPEDHQIHVYKLQTIMSTFVWLDRLFTPALTWQKVFAVQNQESLRDGLVLLHSTRYDFFLEGNPLGPDDIAIVDRLWNWFEGQHDRQIRLTFAISKNKMFKKRKDALKVIGPLMHGLRHWD